MNSIQSRLQQLWVLVAAALLSCLVIINSPLSVHALLIPNNLQSLPESISKAGIRVALNDSNLCGKDALGTYFPGRNVILVCQSEAQPGDSEHKWSERDYSVLMHESTHLLQDCLSGSTSDYTLVPINQTREELESYSEELTEEQVAWIIETYTEHGADDLTLWLEIEAFATQTSADPGVLSAAIDRTCPMR